MKNVLLIGGHDETFNHYAGLGFTFTVFQLADSVGPHLRALTDNIHTVEDFSYATLRVQVEALLKVQPIDLIFSFTEDGLLPAARLGQHFAIAGMDLPTCQVCIDKAQMRRRLEHTEFAIASSLCNTSQEAEHFLELHPAGIVVKAPQGSGSENVFIVNDQASLRDAFAHMGESCLPVLAEEYLAGLEVSIETLTLNGTHQVLAITRKQLRGSSLAEEQHIIAPDSFPPELHEAVSGYCLRLLHTLNYQHGPCHIEVKIDGPRVHLIEINNRVGGGYIGLLVELTTGVDLFRKTLAFHSDEQGALAVTSDTSHYAFAGTHIFYHPVAVGTLLSQLQDVDVVRLIMGQAKPRPRKPLTNDDMVGLVVIASQDCDAFYSALDRLEELSTNAQ
ncbi:ATP-grasp domain-containing protein [Pseudomonas putida]